MDVDRPWATANFGPEPIQGLARARLFQGPQGCHDQNMTRLVGSNADFKIREDDLELVWNYFGKSRPYLVLKSKGFF